MTFWSIIDPFNKDMNREKTETDCRCRMVYILNYQYSKFVNRIRLSSASYDNYPLIHNVIHNLQFEDTLVNTNVYFWIWNQVNPPTWMISSWILKCELKWNYKDNITTLKGSTLHFVTDSFDFYFFLWISRRK